jgi:predicted ATP-binding protein involved in virulence
MRLKRVEIIQYRNFEKSVIDFEKTDFPNVFSIASKNGGGKSTLLQFIFILLHSFMDSARKVYIQNLLENFPNADNEISLVKFVIEEQNSFYDVNFSIAPAEDSNRNFNLYLDIEDTDQKLQEYQKKRKKFQEILELKKEIEGATRITAIIERNMRYIREYINNQNEDVLYREAMRSNDIENYKKLINFVVEKNSIPEGRYAELETIKNELKEKLVLLERQLLLEDTRYITHLKNNQVLLLSSDMSNDLLELLTNRIFLTAPASQVFHFLSEEEKLTIFNEFSNKNNYYQSYYENVKKAKKQLKGFFTYDFASTDLILEAFQKASDEDVKIKRKTGEYGNKYDELTHELKDFLDGKEISENIEGNGVIFKSKNNQYPLSPEDLSHGELKKLGIYIWLKYAVDEESIILMDEVDIALHPQWQYEIVKDLVTWSQGSQFLLATHSPQILSSTYYKNIIKLDNGAVKRYAKPPIDRDINAIITEVMDAPDFPMDLLLLHKAYRKLITQGNVNSDEAKKLKEEILEHESESSSFFQDINFDLELI